MQTNQKLREKSRRRGFPARVFALFTATLLLSAAPLFGGCGNTRTPGARMSEDERQLCTVYTSFYPMYDFASKIGGDKIKLINMVPASIEPHDWEPDAADIAGLERADVFIYNGAGMEHWVQDVLAALKNESLIVVETARGIGLLQDSHAGGVEHGHDGERKTDPHVWLDPKNAKAQTESIKDALVLADPENAGYYESNFEKYAAEYDLLDKQYGEALLSLENKDIIVAHKAYGYLCEAYGLTQTGIQGLSADSEPDPAAIAGIIRYAREMGITTVFFEETASPKVAQIIADAAGAEIAVLSPIEGLTDEQQAAGDDYFSVMRRNLAALTRALQPKGEQD